jgi:hypothetical protein
VPGADLGDESGGRDQAVVWNVADGDDDVVELKVGAGLQGDMPQQRSRIQQALHPADGVSRYLGRDVCGRAIRFHRGLVPPLADRDCLV